MSKSELIVGLDIGTTKICCVVGETSDDGTMNIVGVGESPSTGLRKGVVVNIEQTVQSIRKAVEEAERMANCEIRSVYAGIAMRIGRHMNISALSVQPAAKDTISQSLCLPETLGFICWRKKKKEKIGLKGFNITKHPCGHSVKLPTGDLFCVRNGKEI